MSTREPMPCPVEGCMNAACEPVFFRMDVCDDHYEPVRDAARQARETLPATITAALGVGGDAG